MSPATQYCHKDTYRACRAVLGEASWKRFSRKWSGALAERSLSTVLSCAGQDIVPEFLPDLARLEEIYSDVGESGKTLPKDVGKPHINPTLRVVELSWKNLAAFLDPDQKFSTIHPKRTAERILLWYSPSTGSVSALPADDESLLVLKMIVEGISPEVVAAQGNLPVGAVDSALLRAAARGLVLMPPSRIRRDHSFARGGNGTFEQYLSSPAFTLQWHVTQACDLHCKHCYDRSTRSELKLDEALRILDDMRAFCKARNVSGAVSFTGGNPLLHPAFTEIYRAAADRGFSTAILGNPSSREQIAELIAIQMPAFFQVSLEGLREHNDSIRGPGHYDRTMEFLEVLRELRVYSMVMLTLTSENIGQVLPLAEALRGKTDLFNFNRLSTVGEGANLKMPDARQYKSFLLSYLDAARGNPVMGVKDNLINIILRDRGMSPFGGCTGYGCGAAFNYASLLADGEVHACRKFPSPIGNVGSQNIAEIYDSDRAQRYRNGSRACQSCTIRPVCGGCLACAHSSGLNVFEDKDPFCFMPDK